jgi:NADPH:quinone reductase-like Zn-dependent oxidoreductase
VDAVLDLVGGDALTVSPDLLATGGRLVSIADGAVLGLGGRYFWVRPDAADLAALSELAERGVVQVEVAATFPLEKAADAQRLNAEGHTRGKVIVTVD